MRWTLLAAAALASLALAGEAAAVMPVKPQATCPQILRQPVNRYADVPAPIRAKLGRMAERNGRWNVGDSIGPGDERYPFEHFIAAGHMGQDRWLVIYERGGIAHYWIATVLQLTPNRGGGRTAVEVASANGAPLDRVCRDLAAKLPRRLQPVR